MIRDAYPQHNIVGEEGVCEQTGDDVTWYVDPLDGTNNYSKDLPYYSASVAATVAGNLTAAAVYASRYDELFWATADGGAYLNGRPISVSPTAEIREALLITGFYFDLGRRMEQNLDIMKAFFRRRACTHPHSGLKRTHPSGDSRHREISCWR